MGKILNLILTQYRVNLILTQYRVNSIYLCVAFVIFIIAFMCSYSDEMDAYELWVEKN